ncbi:MAG: hypothetical protein ISP90_18290 [Nevskia sp.]|nr:hypothetical protein [Nevskia sp.]
MAQRIRLLGWVDPVMPARWKETGPCEFRIKLSEAPNSSWKMNFAEQGKNQPPIAIIDQDVLVLTCELNEIEMGIQRIRSRLDDTNKVIMRLERESEERFARHEEGEQEKRKKILAAVSNIRFDET